MIDALFTGPAAWFSFPAVVGTVLFLMRMLLLLMGGHGGHMGDVGHADAGHHDGHSDGAPVLSFQSVTAFLMGFGWGGVAGLKATDWSMPVVIGVGLLCGLAMAAVQAMLLRSALKLQASGNVSIQSTMGAQGEVYVTVPGQHKGRGQVTLVIDGKQRTFDAITPEEEIPSRTRVNVTAVNADNTITVKRVI